MTNVFIFDFKSATTMTTTTTMTMTTTTTMTMTTMTNRLLLYTTQKGCFKNFKYEKQRETLGFFFVHSLIHSRFQNQRIAKVHYPLA
jgi:hypothetical protein